MIVGAAVVEIHVHQSQSLKAKRGVVRSITQRLRNRYNVAVAEVGGQGTWQRATIGIVGVGNDEGTLRKVMEKAVAYVEDLHLAEVMGSDFQIVPLGVDEPGYEFPDGE